LAEENCFDETIGLCDECGNIGVLKESDGGVLCHSCYDMAEDFFEQDWE